MPVLKKNARLYRAKGIKYATGRGNTTGIAMAKARRAFIKEFKYDPPQERCLYEVLGITALWDATLLDTND